MKLAPRAEVVPAPYVFPQTRLWAGNDGEWSVFGINIGTPGQEFEVLVSTESPEIWVPLPEGCLPEEPNDCPDLRGAEPFNGAASPGYQRNLSSTRQQIGTYELDLKQNLGYEGGAEYFYETVRFGAVQEEGGLEIERQLVAGLASKDYFMGSIGLGSQLSSFSQDSQPVDSMIKHLKDQQKIPSMSYSYNAGASYRQKKEPASLILGGYDASRVVPSENSFDFALAENSGLSVGVQSIIGHNTLNGTTSFTGAGGASAGFLSLIDSTVPHIWLPVEVCDQFEAAFGLLYDESTELYLIDETVRSDIQDAEINFKIGNDPTNITSETSINIILPFAAFDLVASWPIYDEPTPYFPIRRAPDGDSQYTLGRTFLQEAFLIVDYERENFTVAQATFPATSPEPTIVAIEAIGSESVDDGSNDDLSAGAIAGIVIGTIAAVVLLLGLLLFFIRRRRQQKYPQNPSKSWFSFLPFFSSKSPGSGIPQLPTNEPRTEIDGHGGGVLGTGDDMFGIQEKSAAGGPKFVEAPGDAEVNELASNEQATTMGTGRWEKHQAANGAAVAELEATGPRSVSVSEAGGEAAPPPRNDAPGFANDGSITVAHGDDNSIQEENLTVISPSGNRRQNL